MWFHHEESAPNTEYSARSTIISTTAAAAAENPQTDAETGVTDSRQVDREQGIITELTQLTVSFRG